MPPRGGRGFNRQQAVKALKESVQTGHRTGLPPKLLDLFRPREQLPTGTVKEKKKPAVPYNGLAQYVQFFAGPEDPEYEPAPPKDRPSSPRLYRNRELAVQCRLDTETKMEKWVLLIFI